MTFRITYIGVPGSGKTTFAHAKFVSLKELGYRVEFVREYARQWISDYGIPTVTDQYFILQKQLELEQNCLKGSRAPDYIVSESCAHLGLYYAREAAFAEENARARAKDMCYLRAMEQILQDVKYDRIWLMPPNAHPLDDGFRRHTDLAETNKIHQGIVDMMRYLNIPIRVVEGENEKAGQEDNSRVEGCTESERQVERTETVAPAVETVDQSIRFRSLPDLSLHQSGLLSHPLPADNYARRDNW